MYYLRTCAAADAIKLTVDHQMLKDAKQQKSDTVAAVKNPKLRMMSASAFEAKDSCLNCSS